MINNPFHKIGKRKRDIEKAKSVTQHEEIR